MSEVDAAHRPCSFLETESQGLSDDQVFRFVSAKTNGRPSLMRPRSTRSSATGSRSWCSSRSDYHGPLS